MADRCWRVASGGVLVERAGAVEMVRTGYRFRTPEGELITSAAIYYLVAADGTLARTFESRMGDYPAQEGYIDRAYRADDTALHALTVSWDGFEPFPDDRVELAGLLPPDDAARAVAARLDAILAADAGRRAAERRAWEQQRGR